MIVLSNVYISYAYPLSRRRAAVQFDSVSSQDVLRDINLNFYEGQLTALVGKNGSGKSTLLKTCVGLVGYQGSIMVEGASLQTFSHQARAQKIAYLPQVLTTPSMSVEMLVSHGRFASCGHSHKLNKKDCALIRDALKLADVWDLRYCRLNQLSGGQKQRAYIAMALAQDTPYLLLDEPMTYLDTAHSAGIANLLQHLAASGRGIIFASHNIPESFSCADRVVIVGDHQIKADDTPENLVKNPELLREYLGVALQKLDDTELLYPYALTKC